MLWAAAGREDQDNTSVQCSEYEQHGDTEQGGALWPGGDQDTWHHLLPAVLEQGGGVQGQAGPGNVYRGIQYQQQSLLRLMVSAVLV